MKTKVLNLLIGGIFIAVNADAIIVEEKDAEMQEEKI